MGKTIRLRDKQSPGISENLLKEVKEFENPKPQRKRKMEPFNKSKERIWYGMDKRNAIKYLRGNEKQ